MDIVGRLPKVNLRRAVVDVSAHIQHRSIRVDFPDHLEYWCEIKFSVHELEELLEHSKSLLLTETSGEKQWT